MCALEMDIDKVDSLFVFITPQQIDDWERVMKGLATLPKEVGVLRLLFESTTEPVKNTYIREILDRLPSTFDHFEVGFEDGWEAEQDAIEEMISIKFEGL